MNRLTAFSIGLAIGTALLATQARAIEPAVIEFTAPTTYTDGSPIEPGTPISYAVSQGLEGGIKGVVATITETSATINTGMIPGNTYCFHVVAIINGQESAPSNEACKFIEPIAPSPVVITVR